MQATVLAGGEGPEAVPSPKRNSPPACCSDPRDRDTQGVPVFTYLHSQDWSLAVRFAGFIFFIHATNVTTLFMCQALFEKTAETNTEIKVLALVELVF